jgi:type II secretory pathway pseudopilin PulG
MRHSRGFLLIELMLVVALIIIIVTLAMPQMSFLTKQLVHSEIEKLATVCYFLRQSALVKHQDQTLVFNQQNGTYSSGDNTYTLAKGVRFGFLPDTYGPPSSPIHRIAKAVTFDKGKITFYADGSISSGTVYLIDSNNNYFYALTTPSAQMAYVRKYEYQQRWVLLS